ERIDISQYTECMVSLRVHSGDLSGGGIQFGVTAEGYTGEDPGRRFGTGVELFTGLPVTSGGPTLLTYGGAAPGQYVLVFVFAQRFVAAPLRATVPSETAARTWLYCRSSSPVIVCTSPSSRPTG